MQIPTSHLRPTESEPLGVELQNPLYCKQGPPDHSDDPLRVRTLPYNELGTFDAGSVAIPGGRNSSTDMRSLPLIR